MIDDTVVMVLAGGVGERLYPLTKERAKPAVYFGGPYRIIDFTLSNCINSNLRKIFIALQYKSLSLSRHLRMGWSVVADELGEFIEILSPQKRVGECAAPVCPPVHEPPTRSEKAGANVHTARTEGLQPLNQSCAP